MQVKLYGLVAAALFALGTQASAQTLDLGVAPAEPALDRYLAKADAASLARAAEQGDLAAGYLLFVLHQREGASSDAARQWLSKLASANTPSARYAYALARYRAETTGQDKGIEFVDAAALSSPAERQRQIASLEAIAPQFPKAYVLLAQIFRDGAWAPADPAKADAFLRKGAAAGAASALVAVAQSLSSQPGGASEVARLADAAAAAGEPGGEVLACAAYAELGKPAEALERCKLAADRGSSWAQLVAGELLAANLPRNAESARQYLQLAARASDPAISDRAALKLAAVAMASNAAAQAIADLEPAGARNALAAWTIGRLYLDHRSDPASAETWFGKALALRGGDEAAISFDLARAVRGRGGDWLPALRQAADKGHAQAALAAAFELQSKSKAEALRYAQAAAKDPAMQPRARELLAFLDATAE